MGLEADLYAVLAPLVPDGRVYRSAFPQSPDLPEWPALRFLRVSGTPVADICGAGDEGTDDVLFQIDVVAQTGREVDDLSAAVIAAMTTFPHPNVRLARRGDGYDPDTRTERASLDYLVSLSSP